MYNIQITVKKQKFVSFVLPSGPSFPLPKKKRIFSIPELYRTLSKLFAPLDKIALENVLFTIKVGSSRHFFR